MPANSIMVGGALANKYGSGGAAWVRLSWVLGLRQLGFDVCFVEQIDQSTCVDDDGNSAPFEECANLAYFRSIVEQFGLAGSAALVYHQGECIWGLTRQELFDRAEAAVALVNLGGHLAWEPLMRGLQRKVYIDLDPGFTQFWHAAGYQGLGLEAHEYHFTIGEQIGTSACRIPTGGFRWRPIRQPVDLSMWAAARSGSLNCFTTVAHWRGPYGPLTYQGVAYGLKVHEFRKFIDLPADLPQRCELALAIHANDARDRERLLDYGWRLVDPRDVAHSPNAFRDYIQASGAELSVAQGIYVATQSGWFSDRTTRYLASGKPALVQDTGFSRTLPTGEGLIAFRTREEAIDGAWRIARNYATHSQAARSIAEQYFDSKRVLGQLVDELGIAP